MARKKLRLYTIGYEQSRPDAVLAALKAAKVDLLVDTRAVAASRKPGFSKRQLAASLDDGEVLSLAYEKFEELYYQNPEFGLGFLKLTSKRLFENIARLETELAARPPRPVAPVTTA